MSGKPNKKHTFSENEGIWSMLKKKIRKRSKHHFFLAIFKVIGIGAHHVINLSVICVSNLWNHADRGYRSLGFLTKTMTLVIAILLEVFLFCLVFGYQILIPVMGFIKGYQTLLVGLPTLLVIGSQAKVAVDAYKSDCKFRHKNLSYQSSLFCLQQIQTYYNDCATKIRSDDNSNVKWHQAVNLMQSAEALKLDLADDVHKKLYIYEMINLGFEIYAQVSKISEARFFSGDKNYKYINDLTAYIKDEKSKKSLGISYVSAESLSYICRFLSVINKANYDLKYNSATAQEISVKQYIADNISDTILTTHEIDQFVGFMDVVPAPIKEYIGLHIALGTIKNARFMDHAINT